MKKYNQFINEYATFGDNFIFAINIKNINYEDFDNIFKEIEKIFPDYKEYGNNVNRETLENILFTDKKNFEKPWALIFNVYKYIETIMRISISKVTTPNWGNGYEYMENILTPEEFLITGFDGVRALISGKKYNL